jgi:23S rRNA (uridine2552-2'-O)-methyltransferase
MKRPAAKGNPWQDHYSRLAKKERFPARSVYKLKEIQQKYHLIKKGDAVLDLGCAPGSWLLYAADLTGHSGRIVGIDLQPVKTAVPAHVKILTADVLTLDDAQFEQLGKDIRVVLSDMAPATTGNKTVDAARSLDLCRAALSVAKSVLVPDGSFVCKIFQGRDFNEFSNELSGVFKKSKIFKPRSSRKASKEIYIIGLGFRTNT